ncbi:hypothetical protein RDWZM_005765 [Blomia tropicalis]|uniref:Large ribosomal subunit protein uL24m n=1 Tax=Blomia tropicalis TaxID=40697 RepID=A0A9Q0RL52_BLOTA|nr:hypothetical protein RDWZM_005765 [Blomia tropicalis]
MRLTSLFFSKVPKNYQYSNFPERFIKKQTDFVEWKTPPYPNYQPRVVRYRKRAYYDIHRPWTNEFKDQNAPNVKHPKIYVQPIKNWSMFVGDLVQILRGKDKGKRGVINYVVKERNWVCVKGLNLSYVLQQRDRNFPGMITTTENPLLVPRDVLLVDPEDDEPTEVEWRYDEEGNQVRVSVRTGRIIPLPTKATETRDYTIKSSYKAQPKDTLPENVVNATFSPQLKTFEMDISDEKGIKEDRIPYPMYWY